MTINNAHNYIKLEIDKTSSLSSASFEQEEIDYWLDDSILKFIKTHSYGNNLQKLSFEENQKRIDDLRTLIAESSLITSSTSGLYDNSLEFAIPSDYLFSIREEVQITYNSVASRVSVTPTIHDRVTMKLRDPFSEHNIRLGEAEPLRLFVGSNIVIIGDGNYTINGIYISYIKTPTKMTDVSNRDAEYTDLSDQAMFEVVKIAAKAILENIGDNRYQTYSIESSVKE